jgi:hypothetical protein
MLRLKEKKAAAAVPAPAVTTTETVETKADTPMDVVEPASTTTESTTATTTESAATSTSANGATSTGGTISLLGVGGVAIKPTENKGKKLTPGEIRIRKGNICH